VATERLKAKTFTINGEAVVREPDGLSRFDEFTDGKLLEPRSSTPRPDRA